MRIRQARCILCVLAAAWIARAAEDAGYYFDRGAERYTRDDAEQAKRWVSDGLAVYPEDPRLLALKQLLDQQQQQQQSSEQKQEGGEQSEQEREQPQDQEEPQDASEQQQAREDAAGEDEKAAEEMTREEATLLLDAMKQQEQAIREKLALDRLRSSMGRLPPVEKDW